VKTRPRRYWYLVCALSPRVSVPRLTWLFYELKTLRQQKAAGGLSLVDRIFYAALRKRFPRFVAYYAGFLHEETEIGPGVVLPHGFYRIGIAGNAVIGARCTITPGVIIAANLPDHGEQAPVIGDDVFLGVGARIVGRCRIGDGARIGAGVTLTNVVVPPGAVIVDKSAYNVTERRYLRRQR